MMITLQDNTEMTSSQSEQVHDSIVPPAATELDAIATKDEQIKALIASVQDLKQQLSSAQQHITDNDITIKEMSERFKQSEDGLQGTTLELDATTITGRQTKDKLTKQCEELLSFDQKLTCAEGDITVMREEMKKNQEELNVRSKTETGYSSCSISY